MNFNFILDGDFLAYRILEREMHNESEEMKDVKHKLLLNNKLGFRKILGEEIVDPVVFIANNNDVNKLIDELISTKKFDNIYKLYNNTSKEVIAIKILNGTLEEDEELTQIKNNLWYKYMDAYKSIFNIRFSNFSNFLLDNDIKKIIKEFKKTEVFKKMYIETEIYLTNVKKYWEENKNIINQYLKKNLKTDFDIKPTVYILHPETYTGYSFDSDKIAWGHYKGVEDLNYNITYLVHEGLHCLIPFGKDETDDECNIKHSIIELISDYELYSLLKGESTLKEGHSYLNAYKKFIYPYWLRYIGLDDNQIIQRLKKDSVRSSDLFDIKTSDISIMNIQQFIDFCTEKYRATLIKTSDKKIKK